MTNVPNFFLVFNRIKLVLSKMSCQNCVKVSSMLEELMDLQQRAFDTSKKIRDILKGQNLARLDSRKRSRVDEDDDIAQMLDGLDGTEFATLPNEPGNFSATVDTRPSSPKWRKLVDFIVSSDDFVEVYTDGACLNNGTPTAKAGVGVWWGDRHILNLSEPVKGKATNNAAEIQACIRALQIAQVNELTKVKIITDSQFTINAMTKWIKKWIENDWKKAGSQEQVKNKDDFKRLHELCQQIQVQWVHCPGHKGIPGNEAADALAVDGAKMYKI